MKLPGLGCINYTVQWLAPIEKKLLDEVEVDETYYGGEKQGKRGRSSHGKALIVIAVEDKGVGLGRIRVQHIHDASAKSINQFVLKNIELKSIIRTDSWNGYNQLSSLVYNHNVVSNKISVGENQLPLVHLVASLLKRWLLGTHQGAVSHEHLKYYLGEFTFHFNRRTSAHRGKLFYRLMQNAVQIGPVPYKQLSK